ncbi:hypothetical protein CC1G_13913 [Coprinopsis cinerea okayama7|uniref:TPR repeat-containing protein n=1 Tax=Coprinopsis cinerea (strain Okayama-7 / 130 / ATCC MYA-4618 / FGSC 9003) TaxID=240176 RepID=D6RKY1_COPC7|nr:hypothetical protein CC1G_13913 [Coprinopsis cinerea okayama7\|eukprot:XP_002911873.1 hypothetical protein CC1G_13913 [Coprinopsis cinerea okayama7\
MLRRIAPSTRALRRPPTRPPPRLQRPFASQSNQPAGGSNAAGVIQQIIADHAATAFKATGRFVGYSAIGIVTVGFAIAAGYEGIHHYVEQYALAPETDDDVKKFQWDISEENWHGDPYAGGTDPGLGFVGRHALRAAWMARNWGIGPTEWFASVSQSGHLPPDFDIPLAQSASYLHTTLAIAQEAQRSQQLHPHTIPELQARYASYLERLGGDYLPISFENFLRAWEGYQGQGLQAARIALRLGDLSSRIKDDEQARKWWKSAMQLCQGQAHPEVGPLLQPSHLPDSPWAQRILASTLVSVSAHMAQTGKLREAQTFEEAALNFLRSAPVPERLEQASPAQALHSFFILHRSSLISIHLAEVLYAQKPKRALPSSIQYLTAAAESSGRVARALAGLPLKVDDPSGASLVPGQDAQLLPTYSNSPNMKVAASRLYRDAKRTSAEAWSLLGVLYERKEGPASKKALECYEMALRWSGKALESEAQLTANESTTESDWDLFVSNYQRAKAASEGKK